MHIPWRKKISRTLRGEMRSLALSSHGIGVVAQTKNGLLVVDPRDFGVSRSLLAHGSYDWEGVSWLSPLLSEKSRMVVVGAHLGALVIPLALQSGSRDIVAFEPSPRTHRLLEINMALNGLPCVVIHRAAVGDDEGVVRFTLNRNNSGNSRVSESGEEFVPMVTLDSALDSEPSRIDLLVMDTEGFEVHAIRGASRTLARTRYFYVEYSPEQLSEQGSTAQEFIERVSGQFESMYLPGNPARFFPARTYVQYLEEISARRGLLLNLLFTNEAGPEPTLIT